MALRRYHNDTLPFPTLYRQNVYYPNVYRDYRSYPYDVRGYGRRSRQSRYDYESLRERSGKELLDKAMDHHGDLGWTLEYATAWCYRFLVGNQTEVADAIDKVRELEVVEEKTPYVIFDHLNKSMFAGKLKDMVYLRWRAQASVACGTTSAPGVVPGIPRACIELNKLPFEDGCGDVDDLLDALIHQMIHAFFLVCCGAQPKHAKQDGRLSDGLHFGVILYTIQDISRQCRIEPLALTFYAAQRREEQAMIDPASGSGSLSRRNARPGFISVDPRGSMVPAPPADGQSHCSHDNRSIRPAQVKNWQVEHYARAIELEMEKKGDVIFDLGVEGKLVPTDRLKGPPSSSYVELIWDGTRIMVPREKALKFKSLTKPLQKEGKYELKLPDCSMSTLKLLYDFLQHRMYWEGVNETLTRSTTRQHRGPPILLEGTVMPVDIARGLLEHIKVFKTAEEMKFEELQRYALKRLYDMPTTSDDPIEALKELYNDGKDSSKPIHAELHRWAREFLRRDESGMPSSGTYSDYGQAYQFRGTSNYEKLLYWHGDRFQEFYNRNLALKDDCKLVKAELDAYGTMDPLQGQLPWNSSYGLPSQGLLTPKSILPRARSWSNALDWRWNDSSYGISSMLPSQTFDDASFTYPYTRPRLLDRAPSSDRVWCKYYGRDGRLKNKNVFTGETYSRLPTGETVLEL